MSTATHIRTIIAALSRTSARLQRRGREETAGTALHGALPPPRGQAGCASSEGYDGCLICKAVFIIIFVPTRVANRLELPGDLVSLARLPLSSPCVGCLPSSRLLPLQSRRRQRFSSAGSSLDRGLFCGLLHEASVHSFLLCSLPPGDSSVDVYLVFMP